MISGLSKTRFLNFPPQKGQFFDEFFDAWLKIGIPQTEQSKRPLFLLIETMDGIFNSKIKNFK